MATIVNASIDLGKITKSKIKEVNGKKWLGISIILNDEPDQYGNTVIISENQTQEERNAKEKKNILGNGKVAWTGQSKGSTVSNKPKTETKVQEEVIEDDTLPF